METGRSKAASAGETGRISIIDRFGVFQLQLELIGDEGDELAVGGLAFCVGNCIAEEALESIQVTAIPCHFNGMANSTLYPGRCGLESFCYLGIQHLSDGVRGLSSPRGRYGDR